MEHLTLYQKLLILAAFLLAFFGVGAIIRADAAESKALLYQGRWVTTNRQLDGTMQCRITRHSKMKDGSTVLNCHFWGVWQGVYFEYDAQCQGKSGKKLIGRANVDGASYVFVAYLDSKEFNCNFDGSRYLGNFRMKRVK